MNSARHRVVVHHPRAAVTPFLVSLAAMVLVLLSRLLPGMDQPVAAQTVPASLPAAPAGWPSTLQLGMSDKAGGAEFMRATAPFGLRYQYLAGGVNTGKGWATWNRDGTFASRYIQESINQGVTPVFTYYMLLQSAPAAGSDEGAKDYSNLQDAATMTAYYNDLKLFFQRAGAFSGTMVVLHVEPDLWGYLQKRAGSDAAETIPAKVAATGLPELTGLSDTVVGFAGAIAALRDAYAPNVVLAYHVSVWGTGVDITLSDPSDAAVEALAERAGNFVLSLRGSFELTFAELSDRDAAFNEYQRRDGGRSRWDADDFRRNVRFLAKFVSMTQQRVVLWQIPYGNTKMRAMNNTWNHYQDNKVEWLLDDPGRAHLKEYVRAGVIALLFGRGANGATDASDAAGDGRTDPEPINGNSGPSLSADDDGGFFKQVAAAYYQAGPIPLLSAESSDVSAKLLAQATDEPPAGGEPTGPPPQAADSPSVPPPLDQPGETPPSPAMPAPLPVISRDVPAFASAQPYPAKNANDASYGTEWRSYAIPAWLAYDLSGVPVIQRGRVLAVYYNNSYGYDASHGPHYNNAGAYTLEANAAAGGGRPPEAGWVPLVTVTHNTYHSRQHVVDLTDYNWFRIMVTASDGSPQNADVSLNLDLHDAGQGVEDDWVFYGDSITATAMTTAPKSGVGTFAQLINAMVPTHFPVQENGGIPFLTSRDGARSISPWLDLFPGKYVALSYGTNDASGGVGPATFYNNYATIVQAVLAAGKVPVVPKIPWGRTKSIQSNGPALNAKVDELYAAYPQIVRGPNFWAYFQEHPDLISDDNIHPSTQGYVAYRQQWALRMAAAVYAAPVDAP